MRRPRIADSPDAGNFECLFKRIKIHDHQIKRLKLFFFEQFQVEILEDHRLDVGSAFGGDGVALEGDVRGSKNARLRVMDAEAFHIGQVADDHVTGLQDAEGGVEADLGAGEKGRVLSIGCDALDGGAGAGVRRP